MTEVSVKIKPLARGGSWQQWSAQMRALLTTKERYDEMLDRAPDGSKPAEVEKDVICKAKLQLHVAGPLLNVVARAATATVAWQALREEYDGDLVTRQPMVIHKVMQLSQGSDSVVQYCDKARLLRDDLVDLELDASVALLCQKFVTGLCDELRIACGAMLYVKLSKKMDDLDGVIAELKGIVSLLPEQVGQVNAAQQRGRDSRKCYYCGKQGHIRRNCFAWKRDQQAGNDKRHQADKKSEPAIVMSLKECAFVANTQDRHDDCMW